MGWKHSCTKSSVGDQSSAIQRVNYLETMNAPAPVHLNEMYKVIRFVYPQKIMA